MFSAEARLWLLTWPTLETAQSLELLQPSVAASMAMPELLSTTRSLFLYKRLPEPSLARPHDVRMELVSTKGRNQCNQCFCDV